MKGIKFDHISHPRKLNLGAGLDKKEGFVNVDLNDFHKPDLVCDVSWLKPLPDGYYDRIVARDILEHIPKNKCENTLLEWNRVLRSGGELEIQVPNVIGLLSLLQCPENQTIDRQKRLIVNLFGTQNYEGDFHFNGFTETLLKHYLATAGFSINTLKEMDDWLFVVVATKVENKRCPSIYYLESDEEFVKGAFKSILKREADSGGLDFYLSILKENGIRESIVCALMASDEYKNLQ